MSIEVNSGDPDLYAREGSAPYIQDSNCDNCPLCKARSDELIDSCVNINTVHGNTFHAMVLAYESYSGAKINFTGSNLLNVTDISGPDGPPGVITKEIIRANKGTHKIFHVTCNGL